MKTFGNMRITPNWVDGRFFSDIFGFLASVIVNVIVDVDASCIAVAGGWIDFLRWNTERNPMVDKLNVRSVLSLLYFLRKKSVQHLILEILCWNYFEFVVMSNWELGACGSVRQPSIHFKPLHCYPAQKHTLCLLPLSATSKVRLLIFCLFSNINFHCYILIYTISSSMILLANKDNYNQ